MNDCDNFLFDQANMDDVLRRLSISLAWCSRSMTGLVATIERHEFAAMRRIQSRLSSAFDIPTESGPILDRPKAAFSIHP